MSWRELSVTEWACDLVDCDVRRVAEESGLPIGWVSISPPPEWAGRQLVFCCRLHAESWRRDRIRIETPSPYMRAARLLNRVDLLEGYCASCRRGGHVLHDGTTDGHCADEDGCKCEYRPGSREGAPV